MINLLLVKRLGKISSPDHKEKPHDKNKADQVQKPIAVETELRTSVDEISKHKADFADERNVKIRCTCATMKAITENQQKHLTEYKGPEKKTDNLEHS